MRQPRRARGSWKQQKRHYSYRTEGSSTANTDHKARSVPVLASACELQQGMDSCFRLNFWGHFGTQVVVVLQPQREKFFPRVNNEMEWSRQD